MKMAGYRRNKEKGNFWQHDNRPGRDNDRRVGFRNADRVGGKGVQRYKVWNEDSRKYTLDSDVDMNNVVITKQVSSRRYTPYRSKSGSEGRILPESPSGWYKVTLGNAGKYNKTELLDRIRRIVPSHFSPLRVQKVDNDWVFYIDNHKAATKLHNSNLKIDLPDGWKLQIRVQVDVPHVVVDNALKEKIKTVMSSRYNSTTSSMNLSALHIDIEFSDSVFVPLNSPPVFRTVFEIIAAAVPNLYSLNLAGNKLYSTEVFTLLKKHFSNLKVLNLSDNLIKRISAIQVMRGMDIEELDLDQNPMCRQFQDRASYIREIRKIFPRLQKLDSVVLPAAVSFGLEEEESLTSLPLPPYQRQYLCNAEAGAIVRQFIEQYYALYDNQTSRQPLVDAYYDTAQFSMSIYYIQTRQNFTAYITESRNLIKLSNTERRMKLLKRGKADIVNFLNTLLKTQHDPASFSVDLLYYAPEMMHLSVCGLFRETNCKPQDKVNGGNIRAFSRTFVLIPIEGGGFKILSDELLITHPTDRQLKMAFSNSAEPTPSTSSSVAGPSSSFNSLPSDTIMASDNLMMSNSGGMSVPQTEVNRKMEMVKALSAQSGMNLAWSEKCLNETDWDYNNALNAFIEFNKQGSIPAEAFQ